MPGGGPDRGTGLPGPRFEEYTVSWAGYFVHTKQNAPDGAPKSMRVEYTTNAFATFKEWVCFEHSGYARAKAEQWWHLHRHPGDEEPVPDRAVDAVDLAWHGAIRTPKRIVVKHQVGEFDRVIAYHFDAKEEEKPDWADVPPEDEVPF